MEIIIALIAIAVIGALWYANRKTGFDANQDGKVDAADIKSAVDNTVAVVKETADVNKDGKVDAADVKETATKAKAGAKKATTKAKEAVKKAAGRGRKPKSKA